MNETNKVLNDEEKTLLVNDLRLWKKLIYCNFPCQFPNIQGVNTIHSQQHFNKIESSFDGIDFNLEINDRILSTLHIPNQIANYTKEIISSVEARYNLQIKDCCISLLGINNFDII